MLDYPKLLTFLDDYISHYMELLKFENNKLEMIITDNIKELNNAIGKEQALIMKTNSFEKKRFALLGNENKDKKFKEIIDETPYEFRPRLNQRYEKLSKLILEIKKINENTQEIVSQRLALINVTNKENTSDTYTKKGAKNHLGQGSATLNKDI